MRFLEGVCKKTYPHQWRGCQKKLLIQHLEPLPIMQFPSPSSNEKEPRGGCLHHQVMYCKYGLENFHEIKAFQLV